MNFEAGFKVGAVFKCVVRKADTHEVVNETPEFNNLVLNSGIQRMLSDVWVDRCCVGSGNSTPVKTQTSLDSFVASTTLVATGVSDSGGIQITEQPYYWYGRRTWRFAVGVATGNLSEIGLGWANTSLWNRALITDSNGNPTTITVLSDEYLDVFCEIRVYPSNSSGSFNVIDKLGNVVSTHSYNSLFYFNQSLCGWYTSRVRFGYGSGTLYRSGFFISPSDMPTPPTTPISSSNYKEPLSEVVGVGSVTSSFNFNGTEANIQHRSFQCLVAELLSRPASNNTTAKCLAYKWQIDPPITKTSDMILTYSVTLNLSAYVPPSE